MPDCPEIYENRRSRATHELSDVHFGVLNRAGALALADMGGYCLDAPDQMPGGSVKSYGKTECMVRQSLVGRAPSEQSLTPQREELARRLIAEMLAEQRICA